MRYATCFAALVLVGGVAVSSAGCFFDYMNDCSYNIGLACYWDGIGGSGGTGGSGGAPPECVPGDNNKNIEESCGVFVAATGSDANGDGSKDKPYLTLATAISKATAETGRVYACADATKPFDEAVEPTGEVTIYGGMDCANEWVYDPKKRSAWTAPADSVPLTVGGDAKVSVHDFAIEARDAESEGGSSLAVLAFGEMAELVLEGCDLVAGAGKVGAAGTTPVGEGPNGSAKAGANGEAGGGGDGTGAALCGATGYLGGAAGQSMCGDNDVGGGAGGQGLNETTGDTGNDGKPPPVNGNMTGIGGKGQDATSCEGGQLGANGANGMPGVPAKGIGNLTSAGYMGTDGKNGQGMSTNGQGGGGGGGAKQCLSDMTKAGPGGGGGGAGGCAGLPGTGGKGGGASIGLVSVGAVVALSRVTIMTATGGDGGKGGAGQQGGSGGSGGDKGGLGACGGGDGGSGGNGGPAGGGLGGHSLGIAFTGPAPAQTDVTIQVGSAGVGGLGGDVDNVALQGEAGQSCQTLNFDEGASSCVP